jgi:hypothetical protein
VLLLPGVSLLLGGESLRRRRKNGKRKGRIDRESGF